MDKKEKMIITVTGLIILAILLIVIMVMGLGNKGVTGAPHFIGQYSENDIAIDESYDVNSINEISIKSNAADIELIENTDVEKIAVKVFAEQDEVKLDNIEGKMNINIDIDSTFFNVNRKLPVVKIYVPQESEKTINIDSDYGDVTVANLFKTKLTADLDYSNLNIAGINEANIESDYGNIDIENVSNLVAKLDYGNINVNKVSNKFQVSNNCGEVEVSEIDIKEDSNIKVDLGNIRVGKTNEVNIISKVDVGNSKVNNNYKESNVRLDLKCNMGNIKVNN